MGPWEILEILETLEQPEPMGPWERRGLLE
jgi:hypothetical protein